MPRPDKQINSSGPLYAPVSSARPVVWKKRAGPETVDVSDGPSGSIEITIDDLTVSIPSALVREAALSPEAALSLEEGSKWAQRPTSAQLPLATEADVGSGVRREPPPTRTEWVVTRTVEGRSYRRTDVLTTVEEHSGA